MKKPLFTIFLFLLGYICLAQETQIITRDSLSYSESFEVLKSNKTTRQGQYKYTYGSKIFTAGFYKDNRKDSIWIEYDSQNNLIAEGRYKQGKRIGEWAAYDAKQQLLSKYDFDHDQPIFFATTADTKTKKYQVINSPGDTLVIAMDNPPFYITGNSVVTRYLNYHTKYPVSARRAGVTGKVVIAFTIDEYGHARDYMVTKSAGNDLDAESLRVVKALPEDWVPGRLNGKKVAAIIEMPIVFSMRFLN